MLRQESESLQPAAYIEKARRIIGACAIVVVISL
jgi:hypothetical protein